MKRHPFDPVSLVLGLTFGGLGLFFLIGERTAADMGWKWMWPFPFIVLGLLFVVSAARRLIPAAEADDAGAAEGDASTDDD